MSAKGLASNAFNAPLGSSYGQKPISLSPTVVQVAITDRARLAAHGGYDPGRGKEGLSWGRQAAQKTPWRAVFCLSDAPDARRKSAKKTNQKMNSKKRKRKTPDSR